MLVHDRLDHLVATVDALEQRTSEPFRLTLVDNASGPDVRNWLADNRCRFARLILRPTNEHVPAFQHGIRATTSDPFIVTDPDLVVPTAGESSWLGHLLDLFDRHPDFGLIGLGLDQANRPPVLEPERIDDADVVDGELVEASVGTWFQLIRRDALRVPYRSDGETCAAVRAAGYRVGWTPGLRAQHLGWDDWKLHPRHIAEKDQPGIYVKYRELSIVGRAPTLPELARAAPAIAASRALGVPDEGLLELAWGEPAVGAVLPSAFTVCAPPLPLPFAEAAADAVILLAPPAEQAERAVREASRVARRAVIAIADLEVFAGRGADELAPPGWRGRETSAIADVLERLALLGDADPGLATAAAWETLEDRERWIDLFAAGAFGVGRRRLWVWEREAAVADTANAGVEAAQELRWRPPPTAPSPSRPPLRDRARLRAQVLRQRARTEAQRLRRRGQPPTASS